MHPIRTTPAGSPPCRWPRWPPPPGPPSLPPSVAAAPASAASATTVKAVETDFHIALSKSTFKAGRYTFVAENKGQTTHALDDHRARASRWP